MACMAWLNVMYIVSWVSCRLTKSPPQSWAGWGEEKAPTSIRSLYLSSSPFLDLEVYVKSCWFVAAQLALWQVYNETRSGNHVGITCWNEIITHWKWVALGGNCINCSIDHFLFVQCTAGPGWKANRLSLSFPAASHNLKHLTYFTRSVSVCGD